MSTKKQNYRLTNSGCMVSAISNVDTPPVGAVWTPGSHEEIAEAEALVNVGFAERTNEEATFTTYSERAEGKTSPTVSGVIDVQEQEDGTFKNANGVRVHSDGSLFVEGDDDALELLGYNVQDIVGDLDDLSVEQLDRLATLESTVGKGRKGVLDGIAAAKAAKTEQ